MLADLGVEQFRQVGAFRRMLGASAIALSLTLGAGGAAAESLAAALARAYASNPILKCRTRPPACHR